MRKLPIISKFRRKKKLFSSSDTERGQALLIVLLVMSVALTVVLSNVSRSITDISVTTYEDDSIRAFSAAEAGIEEALVSDVGLGIVIPSGDLDPLDLQNNPEYTYVKDDLVPRNGREYVHPTDLWAGESATFWFVSQDQNGDFLSCGGGAGQGPCLKANRIDVCWGNDGTSPNSSTTPAVELSIYYDETFKSINSNDYSDVKVTRVTIDPHASRKVNVNFFDEVAGSCNHPKGTVDGRSFSFGESFHLGHALIDISNSCRNTTGCMLMAKVRMFYNDDESHPVGVEIKQTGGTAWPSQGIQINSTGTSGEVTRKVNTFNVFAQLPFVFDSAIFSMGDLAKP